MACRQFCVRLLPEPVLVYCQLVPGRQTSAKNEFENIVWKMSATVSRLQCVRYTQRCVLPCLVVFIGKSFNLCIQPLWSWHRKILGGLAQYLYCWCPASQGLLQPKPDIDSSLYSNMGPGLPWRRFLLIHATSMLRNYRKKCKYISIWRHKNLCLIHVWLMFLLISLQHQSFYIKHFFVWYLLVEKS